MPKILIAQEIKDRQTKRVVVDGQQRLRTILEYIDNSFSISRAHNKEFAGRRFDQLPDEIQADLMKYEIGVDVLYDLPYREILDIFARLNTYTVRLNSQELLNAKYVGYFKQLAYELGYAYVEYFIEASIINRAQASRMAEATLTSDLLVALIGGVQTNKNIEGYYEEYEEEFDDSDKYKEQFEKVMSALGQIYEPTDIALTNWARVHLFYTLFTVIAHGQSALKGLENVPRPKVTKSNLGRLRVKLDEISSKYDRYTSKGFDFSNVPKQYQEFIDYSRRRTTDTGARQIRAKFVASILSE